MNQAIVVFCLVFLNFVASAGIVRAPRVSQKLYTNILRYRAQFQKHFVDREGEVFSISLGQKKYVTVYSRNNSDGGRILLVTFVNDDILIFEDVLTNEKFTTEFQVHSPGLYHAGYIILDSSLVNVTVLFSGNDRSVFLTWGRTSNSFTTGDITDDFLAAFVDEIPTTEHIRIVYTLGEMYVIVLSPKEFQDVGIQKSTDLINWSRVVTAPTIIRGYENIYTIPVEAGEFYCLK